MLDSSPYSFALEVAVAAAVRDHLSLEQWLTDRLRQHALPFFQVSHLVHCLLAVLVGLPCSEPLSLCASTPQVLSLATESPTTLSVVSSIIQDCCHEPISGDEWRAWHAGDFEIYRGEAEGARK